MKDKEIREAVEFGEEYSFLKTDPRLGANIALLTVGGSHSYGTNTDTSDLDIRGVAMWTPENILLGSGFDIITDSRTDTVVNSFGDFVRKLSRMESNAVERLGCRPEHYLTVSPIGQYILDSRDIFLSRLCARSFGGFAKEQIRKLKNRTDRAVNPEAFEERLRASLERASDHFAEKYRMPGKMTFSVGPGTGNGRPVEAYISPASAPVPVREYLSAMSELEAVVGKYDRDGQRVGYAVEKGKVAKMMMHSVRAYHMALDILRGGKIVTFREKDHDELIAIRNGCYLDGDGRPKPEFFELDDYLEAELAAAEASSVLPEKPDEGCIRDFIVSAHRMQMEIGIDDAK